jgi:hypothetical protein
VVVVGSVVVVVEGTVVEVEVDVAASESVVVVVGMVATVVDSPSLAVPSLHAVTASNSRTTMAGRIRSMTLTPDVDAFPPCLASTRALIEKRTAAQPITTPIHFWRGNVNPQVKLSAPKRVLSGLS